MSESATATYEWHQLPWRKLEVAVFKLERRIYKASHAGDIRRVHRLQKLLWKSRAAKLLAVRRVTQDNQGKNTAGIDGIKALTPRQRCALAAQLGTLPTGSPTRRVWIPKPGKDDKRPLSIPTLHDRGLQALVKIVLEPEWEARFEPNSYGFRPGRSVHDAIGAIFIAIEKQPKYALEADIAKCFDRIDQPALLRKIKTFPTLNRLVKAWLQAGVLDNGVFTETTNGTPQGGVASPPTKLQTFFFEIVITRIWVDPKHDIDLVVRHFHPLDQRSDEVALARPVGGLQPVVEFGGKVLQPTNNQLQFPIQCRLICQRLALLLQPGEALAQAGNPRLKLGLVNEALH